MAYQLLLVILCQIQFIYDLVWFGFMNWNFWGHYQKLTLKQQNKTKKLLDIKVLMLKINKLELKTNETLITQATNALFYKDTKTNNSQWVAYQFLCKN